jgi:hypothetical protein
MLALTCVHCACGPVDPVVFFDRPPIEPAKLTRSRVYGMRRILKARGHEVNDIMSQTLRYDKYRSETEVRLEVGRGASRVS